MRYLFFITIFIVLFSIPCFSRTCKILCTIVSPFLTQPGLLVMGGCIIGWVSSVVQLPSVCASTLSGTRLSVPSRLYRRTNNYGAKVWKAVWGTIFIWGESTGVDGYTEQNFSPRDNTSWCFKTKPTFSRFRSDLGSQSIGDQCDNALIDSMNNATTLSSDGH